MSAQRYGGTYSPGQSGSGTPRESHSAGGASPAKPPSGGDRFRGRRANAVDVRGVLLYILPTPLLFAAIADIGNGNAVAAVADLVPYALLLSGAWLLREGQKAHAAYDARAVARRPLIPRKLMAAAAAGLGVALATLFGWGQGPVTAGGMGALAAIAHVLAFGLDPMNNKGIDLSDMEAGRVAEALDQAEGTLSEISRLAHTIRDREIEARVDTLVAAVRGLLKQVDADPRDLPRARRYLSVYLKGAHEATRKYAESHEVIGDAALRTDYLALLGDLEQSFQRGRATLLEDDRTDLEVEIEVLRDRLGESAPR